MRKRLEQVSRLSHDNDTQTACVVVAPTGREIVSGANRMPYGVAVTPDRLQRPAKYLFIMHAERFAVAQAARKGESLAGCTMYLNWFPCLDCAASIVQAGISVLVADREKYEARQLDPRYYFAQAMQILTEGGVQVTWLQDPACPSCRKHGVSFEPRSCQSTETHGLDCGPFERFFDEWFVCSECGAALSKEEVQSAQEEAGCVSAFPGS